MQLSLRTFNTLVQNMAAAVQAAATQLLDLTVGSTLRAVIEANASIALWMQWLVLANPLVYVSEGLRAAFIPGVPHLPVWAFMGVLTVGTAAVCTVAVWTLRR